MGFGYEKVPKNSQNKDKLSGDCKDDFLLYFLIPIFF